MKTIDHNGWLHSGDLGFVDSEGYLKITGRIKELIITAGGENVAPVLIENQIKVRQIHYAIQQCYVRQIQYAKKYANQRFC
ncbi:hypothetical protein AAMO2058_000341600 [Amorphochlora amoebiformis]